VAEGPDPTDDVPRATHEFAVVHAVSDRGTSMLVEGRPTTITRAAVAELHAARASPAASRAAALPARRRDLPARLMASLVGPVLERCY